MSLRSYQRPSRALRLCAAAAVAPLMALPMSARAQGATADGGATIAELIVTAQKREERINDVPMSITAASGEQLLRQRVTDPADLQRVVPGFSFTPTQFGTPVYTLRGVGFYDSTLSASPAVSVYVDEVALPFPAMAQGALFDLDRVEVLKGPQGTLFGQNSTGGAINYVAAKPTRSFAAGADASLGSYAAVEASGFVSGPLSETLSARAAIKTQQGGEWQKNYTRSDRLGAVDFLEGRVALDWKPSDRLRAYLNLTGWRDRSDTQAPQLIGITPSAPATLFPEVANAPLAPSDARAANWDPEHNLRKDNSFYGANLRLDGDLSAGLTLTSITAYQHFRRNEVSDIAGTTAEAGALDQTGRISSWFQELRVSGALPNNGHWVVGANYEKDRTTDAFDILMSRASNSYILGFHFPGSISSSDQDVETKAVFANGDLGVTETLTAEAGVRYTSTDRSFAGCSADVGEGSLAAGIGVLQSLFGVPPGQRAQAGQCVTLNAQSFLSGVVTDRLKEDNLSWRAGLKWKPAGGATLLYANVSQGYKSGSFPTLAAAVSTSLGPATQEKLLAYEAGFKTPLLDRHAQLNGAVYYYDYKDKQLVGNVVDPIFGRLARLVNIPKSDVYGAELQLLWNPLEHLTLSAAGAYTHTEIKEGTGINAITLKPESLSGDVFPYSPRWQLVADAEYRWPLGDKLEGFVGGDASYRSRTKSGVGANEPLLSIDAYGLVNLRAGIQDPNGRWRLSAWVQNLTDEYYWTNVVATLDTTIRYAGKPRTYGLALRWRY